MTISNYIPLILLLAFVFAVVFFVLLVIWIVLGLAFKKSDVLEQQQEQAINEAYLQAYGIIQQAKHSALTTLTESNDKAQQIINEAHVVNKHSQKSLDDNMRKLALRHLTQLDKTSNEFLDFYKNILKIHSKDVEDTLSDATQKIEANLEEQIEDFKGELEQKTVKVEQEVAAKVEKSYAEVESDIEKYKATRLKELDAKILDIVYAAVKTSIGKTLNIADHESIILAILEEEKRKGGLYAKKSNAA